MGYRSCEVEQGVLVVMSELLKSPGISADDNFFERGGTSLLAMQLISRVEAAFGVRVPFAMLFERRTGKAISAHVLAQENSENLGWDTGNK